MQYTVAQVEQAIHNSRLDFYAEVAAKTYDISGLAGIANTALSRRIDETFPLTFIFDLASRFTDNQKVIGRKV